MLVISRQMNVCIPDVTVIVLDGIDNIEDVFVVTTVYDRTTVYKLTYFSCYTVISAGSKLKILFCKIVPNQTFF